MFCFRYPEKNTILCSEGRCTLAIGISYLLPVILCAPAYFTITLSEQKIREDNQTFILYHTDLNEMFKNDKTLLKINFWIYAVFLKLLPCCILTVISCWLIYTLFKAKKRHKALRSYDCVPLRENKETKKKASKAERRADRTTKMLLAVLFLFLITEFPQGIFGLFIGIQGKDLFLGCYQMYGEVMDILALINGAINFILYCCMNRMFRSTFGKLFKHKILAPWAPASEIHTSYVWDSDRVKIENNNVTFLQKTVIFFYYNFSVGFQDEKWNKHYRVVNIFCIREFI